MSRRKPIQRITAMALSVLMVVGMTPAAALAKAASLPAGGGGLVTGVQMLDSGAAGRSVPLVALGKEPVLDSGDEAAAFATVGTSSLLPNGTEHPETVGGVGTEEDPLRIETAAQLAALAWSVNHGLPFDGLHLVLMSDLSLSDYDGEDAYGKGWVPIGGYYGGYYDEDGDIETYAFSGTFDGNHRTIRNLYVERGERYVGLFGYVKEGTVKNLTVEDGNVEGYAATGGIVGALYNGQIENCVFSGSVTGEESTGGIVGDLGISKVEDCKNIGSITGKAVTGGIVGGAGGDGENDYLRNCINTGTVTGADAYTGGIVGLLVGMTADYCVNTGTVQGGTDLNTGGVAGTISEGIIQNCVNDGPVSGSANNVGGLAGLVRTSTIRNCINYADVSDTANSVGGVAGFVEEGSAVTNCLTTGNIRGEVNITEPGGVGGVVGWLQNGSGDENTITGCVALGQSVTKEGDRGNVARIASVDGWNNEVFDNFAWSGMELFWGEELIPEEDYRWLEDGENADVATLHSLWTTGALAESWSDAGVWTLAEGKLPALAGLPHQSGEFPSHISGITGVTVSPASVGVERGAAQGFTAIVTGIGAIDDTVTWHVSGAVHAGTAISSSGMLTVAADETAETLIVTATATGNSNKKGTASITVTDPPVTRYALTVNSGSGSGEYAAGANVTLTAAAPPENKLFDRWIVTSGRLDLSDATANPITIRMPAEAVAIGAIYRDRPSVPDPTHAVTLNGGGAGALGAGSYVEGRTVSIYAGTRSGYTFTRWTSSDVTITGAGSKTASFVMPGRTVAVTANWSYSGGGGGDVPMPPPPPHMLPTMLPGRHSVAAAPVAATAGANGTASVNIPANIITDAIARAQADASAQGSSANDILVELNIAMPQGATSLRAALSLGALQSLVLAGVEGLAVNGAPVSLTLNQEALRSIQTQAGGGIVIDMAPAAGLPSPAQSVIGGRPAYSITITSTNRVGGGQSITGFGSGMATLALPYSPGGNEAVGHLFGVYLDGSNPVRIPGSVYDTNSQSLLIPTNHLSVYGVSYASPADRFADVEGHWAGESIDYVVGRGLLTGTSSTTFAPNAAMTRGMLATALGRLAGVDAQAYPTASFTDVRADSASYPYIEWAYRKGVMQGVGNGRFAPDRAITREEAAVIFATFAKVTGCKLSAARTAAAFSDAASIGADHRDGVTAMQQAGVVMGEANNRFYPKSNATRAEVSSMLHRYVKLTADPATAQGWAKNDDGQSVYYQGGKPLTGWQTVGGVEYFFSADGTLAKSAKADDHEADGHGAGKTK